MSDVPVTYNYEHDAYYNSDTREWLEKKCSDPKYEYCANRPNNAIKENLK